MNANAQAWSASPFGEASSATAPAAGGYSMVSDYPLVRNSEFPPPPGQKVRPRDGGEGFLASHKMMLAVGAGTALMLLVLLIRGQWVLSVLVALAGAIVAACGFLPQTPPEERAAAQAARRRGKEKQNSAGLAGGAAASGGGVFVVIMVVLRVMARASRNMPEEGGDPSVGILLGIVVGGVLGVVALVALLFGFVKLGQSVGFYQATGGYYLAGAGLLTIGGILLPGSGIGLPNSAFVLEAGDPTVRDEPPLAQDAEPFPIRAPLPPFPGVGPKRIIHRGRVNVEMAEVRLPSSGPVGSGLLYVYTPAGQHTRHSLPCVFIAPAGASAVTGMILGEGDQPEHIPYVEAGFAVVSYEVDGYLEDLDNATPAQWRRAFQSYRESEAGLVNARNALEFVLAKMPEVDPERLYTAGHSSAGKQALLFACHEPRIKGCISYAGVCNVPASVQPYYSELKSMLPDVDPFLQRSSPSNHVQRLNCPVFLFHSLRDDVVRSSQSQNLADKLNQIGKEVKLVTAFTGDHYDSMIRQGIPGGIQWLKQVDAAHQKTHAPGAAGEDRTDLAGRDPTRPPASGRGAAEDSSAERARQLAGGGLNPSPAAPGGTPRNMPPDGLPSQPPNSTPPQFTPPEFTPPQFTPPPGPTPPSTPPGVPTPTFRPPGFPPGFPGPGSFPGRPGGTRGSRPGNETPAAGGSAPAYTGDPANAPAILEALESGDISRTIQAFTQLKSLDPSQTPQRPRIAEKLVELVAEGQINAAIGASLLLSDWATPEQVPRMVEALEKTNSLARHQILRALGAMADPRSAAALAERLTNDQDRGFAASALSRMGEVAEPEVLKYAEHEDRGVRQQVVSILQRIGTKQSIPALQRVAESDPDMRVRFAAQVALRRIQSGP